MVEVKVLSEEVVMFGWNSWNWKAKVLVKVKVVISVIVLHEREPNMGLRKWK